MSDSDQSRDQQPITIENSAGHHEKRFLRSLVLLGVIVVIAAIVAGLAIKEGYQPQGTYLGLKPSDNRIVTVGNSGNGSLLMPEPTTADSIIPPSTLSAISSPAQSSEAVASMAQSPASNADTANLKGQLSTLSASLVAIQESLAGSARTTEDIRAEMRNTLASAIAFTRLQYAADNGRKFVQELGGLKKALAGHQDMGEALAELDAVAETGAPSLPMLKTEFAMLYDRAFSAVQMAEAGTWWERLLVSLRNMVTVRKAGGENTHEGRLAAIGMKLDAGQLVEALEITSQLPTGAQAELAEWRMRAANRLRVDAALAGIAEKLVAPASEAAR